MSAGATIKLRRDTSAGWTAVNPVLAVGEPGLETDTAKVKYGDGFTAWNSLPYSSGNVDLEDVSSDIIPAEDGVYNLGSPEKRWGSLYLTGNTIYLGDVTLSGTDGNLTVESSTGDTLDLSAALVDRGSDTNDWNSLTQMGLYTVNRASWAGVTGAPTDSLVFKGTLQVLYTTNGTETSVSQIFLPAQVTGDVTMQFNRSRWGNTWTSWYKIVNDDQIVHGGSF